MSASEKSLGRRRILTLLGAGGLSALVAACGRSSSTTSAAVAGDTSTTAAAGTSGTAAAGTSGTTTTPPTAAPTTTAGTAAVAACVLTPEATEGPYYLKLDEVRSDITEGKGGAPLALTIVVADATTCMPIKDASVEIWHCDAGGVYSGFGSATAAGARTFLRGTQMTGATGAGTFQTVYPGWYRGRAVHIHMKVRIDDAAVHTGQFFFDDTLTDTVYQAAPYNAQGTRDTRNANDSIYRSAGAASAVLDIKAQGSGYEATITVGVKRT